MNNYCAELPAKQVHIQLTKALTQLQRAEQNALLWFAEIMHRELYQELGYSSIQQYSGEALGFTQNKTYQFIRLAGALARLPQVKESVASGEIGWTKAREVAKVATPRTQKRWIREAKRSSCRQLEQKVVAVRKKARTERRSNPNQQLLNMAGTQVKPARPGAHSPPSREVEVPVTVTLRFTPEQLARYEALLEKIEKVQYRTGGRRKDEQRPLSREERHLAALEDHLDSLGARSNRAGSRNGKDSDDEFVPRGKNATNYQIIIYKCDACGQGVVRTRHGAKELSAAALQAAACDARIQPAHELALNNKGKQDSAKATQEKNRATIPPSTRQRVMARDRHRCRLKGCGQTRFLEVHHLVPRAKGGDNKAENLITLCASCHRLLHDRYLRGDTSPDRLQGLLSKE